MLFCPTCANVLLVEYGPGGFLRFCCQTCPYVFNITKKHTRVLELKGNKSSDVFDADAAWDNAPTETIKCGECGNGKAYFMQMQIRSADEPMTTIYKCTEKSCGFVWREG